MTKVTFTLPDGVIQALERKRLEMYVPKSGPVKKQHPDGTVYDGFDYGLKYDTVQDLIVAHLIETLVTPALDRFPPDEIAEAHSAVQAAADTLEKAKARVVAGLAVRLDSPE